MTLRPLLCSPTLLLLALAVQATAAAAVPEVIRYNHHVRPILSNNCYYCHGPDDKHREADLRLDTYEGATVDLGGYAAVVPGQPDASVLIERVAAHDPDMLMPPVESKRPRLSDDDVAILRKWIEQGAKYEGHWAFLPLSDAPPPEVKQPQYVRNAIDRYILNRLEREGIVPSAEADRETLIRRVSLDLIGLPPSPEEVAAFLADADPCAYEKLVDRLLASPHYGERWGRHWLDQARYADSNGYSIDSERQMWPYRDWVIKAVNDDLHFDKFTIEQLAGDLLPNPTKNQLVATAFHRNTLINEEGGTDREQFRNEAVVDRVNTTAAVWLGLTVACAQCHTHKFDPITHREYYELFAFFNQGEDVNNKGATVNVVRGEVFGTPLALPPAPPPSATPEQLAKRQVAWEPKKLAELQATAVKPTMVTWAPVQYVEYDTKTGAGFQLQSDNSLLSDGRGAFNDTYRILGRTDLKQVAAVRLRVLTHESLPKGGPGRAGNGNFVLTRVKLLVDDQEQSLAAAFADHEQPGYAAAGAIDDDPKSGWAINVGKDSQAKLNANHEAVFIVEKPLVLTDRPIELQLFHELNENYLIGRFAIEVAETAPVGPSVSTPASEAALLAALTKAADIRTPAESKLVREAFEQVDPVAKKVKAEAAKKTLPAGTAEVMIMKEIAQPRQTLLLQRGDFLRPDTALGALHPGGLHAVPPALPAAANRNRLDLAKWLVDPRNPLTPRVTMNRAWVRFFGRGIVETEEDFGTQGSQPTHPELLDWLAGEFLRRGGSPKAMHRLIVTSGTYRQSSEARPDLAEKDPRNLLLARQERLRMEAEIVRDAALAASGLFSGKIGGPGVRPPQPEGVYAFTQNTKKWEAEVGGDRYRRGLYTVFFRSAPHPLFTTFDAPDFQTVCTRRIRSNTPLQALNVANDVAFLELAQGIAARTLRETAGSDLNAQLRRAFELCLSRQPSAKELDLLRDYFDRQLQRFATDQAALPSLLSAKLTPAEIPPATAAAHVSVARALLNTDNFITRE